LLELSGGCGWVPSEEFICPIYDIISSFALEDPIAHVSTQGKAVFIWKNRGDVARPHVQAAKRRSCARVKSEFSTQNCVSGCAQDLK
jgi:hypothetical protein